MEKTFDVKCGFVGVLPDGKKTILFETDDEATEYIRELEKENNEKEEDPDD